MLKRNISKKKLEDIRHQQIKKPMYKYQETQKATKGYIAYKGHR